MDILTITISSTALCIASLSLGWNIYKDVILKARLKVNVSNNLMLDAANPQASVSGSYLHISVVNLGPGHIVLNSVHQTIIDPEEGRGFYKDPTEQLPKKLDVGELYSCFFKWDQSTFANGLPKKIGALDSFGRMHWAKKSQITNIRNKWLEEFPP